MRVPRERKRKQDVVIHDAQIFQKSPRSTSILSIMEASKEDLSFRGELARADDNGSGDTGRELAVGCGARTGVPFMFGVPDLFQHKMWLVRQRVS